METKAELADTPDYTRQLFIRHHSHYEVSPYFVVLDVRTFGVPPSQRRIHSGFDLDLYGTGPGHGSALSFRNGEIRAALNELRAACRAAVKPAAEYASIEVIPLPETLVLNVKNHFEPEALVRIRINSRGLGQPAGTTEEKARADVGDRLESLGVRRT